ncbi:MAG TPA: AAA family ATPase, partial [Chloroflexota bacterium]|nr:AAA family ATPase [Chloroflexota bacterium]
TASATARVAGGPVWARPEGVLLGLLVGAWYAPLGTATGALGALEALLYTVATLPLFLALAVVLAGLWPLYGPLVRRFVRRPAAGGDGGRGPGHRSSDKPDGPVAVTLRPVPTQRIATAVFGEDAWTVKPLYGPGLLAMIVAPPGVGKTELAYGSLAAAVDGLAFCGLETRRPRRVLLLSEMEPKTIQPALRRWGFVAEPPAGGIVGAVQRLRLRYLRPDGSPGHLIDVVHASDAYAPDDEGRRPSWADVIRATVPVVERGRYDLLLVDSLARWMGNDSSNAAMLDALGALRQVTRRGVGVLAPHHCAKDASPPYEPRGGSAILGELDLCWSLARLPGCADPLHDPRRVLACVKSRFAELTPPPIRIERVDMDPAAPRPRYGYRLLDAPQGKNVQDLAQAPLGVDALSEQQRRVLEALAGADGQKATTPELMAATELERNRVQEAVLALIKARLAVVAGAGAPSPKGGRPPARYALTPWALEQLAAHGADPGPPPDPAVRLLHEALDPQPQRAPGGEAA